MQVACNYGHTYALKNDGTLVGWGDNSAGQINTPSNATGITQVACGRLHTYALKNDGTLVGWGDNGQINTPSNATGITQIACGGSHTYALKNDGTLVGWGNNNLINTPSNATGITQIACSTAHTYALKNDGTLVGWGYNDFGQINTPSNATGVTQVACDRFHTYALRSWRDCNNNGTQDADDVLFGGVSDLDGNGQPDTCQGAIEYARSSSNLGAPNPAAPASFTFTGLVTTDADVPLAITATGDFDATNEYLTVRLADTSAPLGYISLGRLFESGGRSCSAGSNSGVINVPKDTFNRLAEAGSITVTLLPSPYVTAGECPGGSMSVRLAYLGIGPGGDCDNNARLDVREIGENRNLDYNRNGNLDYCDCRDNPALDRNRNGVLDVLDCLNNPSIDCDSNGHIDQYELVDDPGLDCNANGRLDSCDVAGKNSDRVIVWGGSVYSGMGSPPLATCSQFAVGGYGEYGFALALDQNGTLYCWGNFGYIRPQNLGACRGVAAGQNHCAVIDSNGLVKAWGYNGSGQCGTESERSGGYSGDTDSGLGAYWTKNLGDVVQIAAGDVHTAALRSDGSCAAWGANMWNQVSPVNTWKGIRHLSSGFDHNTGVRLDGTVICAGAGTYDYGSGVYRGQSNPPTDLTDAVQAACGYVHTLALRSNGGVVAWGAGKTTEVNNNEFGQSIVPTDLGPCVSVAAGMFHSVALQSNGIVRAWGAGTIDTQSNTNWGQSIVPNDMGTVTMIAAGAYNTMAFRPASDANSNNRPDACDLADNPSLDRDSNGVIDALDIRRNPALDCNRNVIIDTYDLLDHPEWDCDGNARIDTCDFAEGSPDDDADGHLDKCEVARGDLDLNGEVDTADLGLALLYMGEVDSPFGDLDGDGIITTADVSLLLLNFGPVTWP
jgi:alpha-tubulin suppressor-like RCC1 family protein